MSENRITTLAALGLLIEMKGTYEKVRKSCAEGSTSRFFYSGVTWTAGRILHHIVGTSDVRKAARILKEMEKEEHERQIRN